jgi:glucose/arabinose dehydrogenase/cytochrome c551/c552/type 1 glutamine amidotransferase
MQFYKNSLFRIAAVLACAGIVFGVFAYFRQKDVPKVLVFSKTKGFRHSSIPQGIAAIQKLGQEHNFTVDTTENAGRFTEDNLKQYATVVFLNTTGDVLNPVQQADFERYIQAGGGYVGVHAATDTEYGWPWYNKLSGAYFASHPGNPNVQEGTAHVVNRKHPSTKGLPKKWTRTDEFYDFKSFNPDVKVLIKIDEKTYKEGKMGDNHPMAWYHDFDGGRAFYTNFGHTESTYTEDLFVKHLWGGLEYAMGGNKPLDYAKARSQRVPEEDRFVKTTLTQGTLYEPTEMAVLPNLDVLISQRRGEVMLYSNQNKSVKQVGFLNVYHKATVPNVNAEEGIMGLAADPNFANNRYVYLFYSPVDTSVNRLSRFEFRNDTIDPKTEKVVLQFYSQRNICCHTGGSIAFGNDNLLYLSTGDNSTPFDEKNVKFVNRGYAPLNDLPGHEQYDARRSSGNTNDLRGKVLRIRIKPDGTYDIPEGNLFPKGMDKTRPEIYTMGHRNPYRISVDKKTNILYWGEVGPDAREDSLATRGPRGYDEVNQARQAGNFGWPYFIGNNYAYRRYDYATGKSGEPFDPAKPLNESKFNTGITQLPPTTPAFIYYPYAESKEFPEVGTGGRNAMAGPVYYAEAYPKETRFPDYYNGKLFVYDWIRNWVKAVTMKPNGDFASMEPFMPGTAFAAPIDMEMGPDGRMYVLEYGKGWFSKNPDAGLARIDYFSGNRPPKVDSLMVDKLSGSLPYSFTARVNASDPEKDKLSYVWTVGTTRQETTEPQLQYTLSEAGSYPISVEVMDNQKLSARSGEVEVYAGNEQPQVEIAVKGNRSFYFPGKPVEYQVKVTDKDGKVDLNNVYVATDYVKGTDLAAASMGHQVVSEATLGKNIMLTLDCRACHQVSEASVGPSFTAVAQRYQKDANGVSYLTAKIIKGGGGVWGEVAMPAHPTLKESDAQQIVKWMMSLANNNSAAKSLPASGKVSPTGDPKKKDNTVFTLTATYTDEGGAGIRPLTGASAVYLRNPQVRASEATVQHEIFKFKMPQGNEVAVGLTNGAHLVFKGLDLTDISSVDVTAFSSADRTAGGKLEVRLGSPTGKVLGTADVPANHAGPVSFPVAGNAGTQDLYFVFVNPNTGGKPLFSLDTIQFNTSGL